MNRVKPKLYKYKLGIFLILLLSLSVPLSLFAEGDFDFEGYRGDIYQNYGNFRICNPIEPDRSRYIYAILHMMLTDTDEAVADVPRYLQIGMEQKEADNVKSYTYYPVLRYIKYADMKKLIGLIYYDAVDTKAGIASKWDFIEELTGYLFTPDGLPLIDENGNLQRRRTRYDDLFKLSGTDMTLLAKAFLDGCHNPDPRIRLTCLSVLEGFGPHPMMKAAIIYGISQETIGDMFENFPFNPKNVRKYRHKYANINGCEDDDIPYRRFSLFERRISRLELCYHIEKTKDVEPEDFMKMSNPLFVTLTDNIVENPFFPAFYDNELSEEDYFIPADVYSKRESVYKYLKRNSLIALTEDNVTPLNKNTKNKLAYVSNDDKIIVRVNSKYIPKEGEQPQGDLDREEFLRIINLFIGGLDNNDYAVKNKCASFLVKVYNYPDIDESLKLYILQKLRNNGLYNIDMEKDINNIPRKTVKVRTE